MMDINEFRKMLEDMKYVAAEIQPVVIGEGSFPEVSFYIATEDAHEVMVVAYERTEETPYLHFSRMYKMKGSFDDLIDDILTSSLKCNQFKYLRIFDGNRFFKSK